MTQIQLRIYLNPGQAEAILQIKRPGGDVETLAVMVDTGAEIALLPIDLLGKVEHRLLRSTPVSISQAGVARQDFTAIEAEITVYLEDLAGNYSPTFVIPAWFADTETALIGFGGILERAIFHLDMPNLSGYLEFANG